MVNSIQLNDAVIGAKRLPTPTLVDPNYISRGNEERRTHGPLVAPYKLKTARVERRQDRRERDGLEKQHSTISQRKDGRELGSLKIRTKNRDERCPDYLNPQADDNSNLQANNCHHDSSNLQANNCPDTQNLQAENCSDSSTNLQSDNCSNSSNNVQSADNCPTNSNNLQSADNCPSSSSNLQSADNCSNVLPAARPLVTRVNSNCRVADYSLDKPGVRRENSMDKLKTSRESTRQFKALKVSLSDYISKHFYESVKVSVHSTRLVVECRDPQQPEHYCGELEIVFSDITGLSFQYEPMQNVLVVIELCKRPQKAPNGFSSVVYLMYCSKHDCEKYLENIVLKRDERLQKLAIQGLPTWSVIVNRFYLPVYYSFNVRRIITLFVNIYVIISLVWGFYDLYKNLPFVGNAMRRILEPIATLLAPLKSFSAVLFIPFVHNYIFSFLNLWYRLLHSVLSTFYQLLNMSGVFHLLQSIINFKTYLFTWVETVWDLFKLPVTIVVMMARLFARLISNVQYLITGPISILVQIIKTLFFLCSVILQVIVYPISWLKQFIVAGEVVRQAANTIQQVQHTTNSASHVGELFQNVKENVAPVSQTWTGIRRIIDAVIHWYNDKIKVVRCKSKQRLLILALVLVVSVALVAILIMVL